jgi:antitoxin (DNA-binding transcriptional repressor) of toxin-antitoxin stability system
MTETLSKSQADLPRLVEIASQGEDVVITVDGKPKARLTRTNILTENDKCPHNPVDLDARVKELATLRERYSTGGTGLTVDQILEETRADRP